MAEGAVSRLLNLPILIWPEGQEGAGNREGARKKRRTLPPFAWLDPLGAGNAWAWRVANPAFYQLVYEWVGDAEWDRVAGTVADTTCALLLHQLPSRTLFGASIQSMRTQAAIVAFLPAMWTLHTGGTRREYDLWLGLPHALYPGTPAWVSEASVVNIATRLLYGEERLPTRSAYLREYVMLAGYNSPRQELLGGVGHPSARSLFDAAVRRVNEARRA